MGLIVDYRTLGCQVGSPDPKEHPHAKNASGITFLHDESSLTPIWHQRGRETNTQWQVMVRFQNSVDCTHSERADWKGTTFHILYLGVTRLRLGLHGY